MTVRTVHPYCRYNFRLGPCCHLRLDAGVDTRDSFDVVKLKPSRSHHCQVGSAKFESRCHHVQTDTTRFHPCLHHDGHAAICAAIGLGVPQPSLCHRCSRPPASAFVPQSQPSSRPLPLLLCSGLSLMPEPRPLRVLLVVDTRPRTAASFAAPAAHDASEANGCYRPRPPSCPVASMQAFPFFRHGISRTVPANLLAQTQYVPAFA